MCPLQCLTHIFLFPPVVYAKKRCFYTTLCTMNLSRYSFIYILLFHWLCLILMREKMRYISIPPLKTIVYTYLYKLCILIAEVCVFNVWELQTALWHSITLVWGMSHCGSWGGKPREKNMTPTGRPLTHSISALWLTDTWLIWSCGSSSPLLTLVHFQFQMVMSVKCLNLFSFSAAQKVAFG